MISFILTAGLGANFIVVVLLFRRLRRDLGRQLRDMRAEHNSEAILSALKEAPERTHQQAVQAANGSGLEPEPSSGGTQPVRRKKHLGLFIGGAVAAFAVTLGQAARDAWQMHRGKIMATAAVAATTTVALLVHAPWENRTGQPPSAAPTSEPTPGYTQSPPSGPTPSATRSQSTNGPDSSGSFSPGSTPGHAGPMETASLISISRTLEPTATPSHPVETPPPSSEIPPGSSTPEPTPPAEPSAESPADELPTPPATSSPCIGVGLAPVLDVDVCLLGGGGG